MGLRTLQVERVVEGRGKLIRYTLHLYSNPTR